MYLHLGHDTVVKTSDIVGIFDLDITTVSKHTRNYLSQKEKEGNIVNVSFDLPKSFIVCRKKRKTTVYLCQLSPQTLLKREKS